MVNQFYFPTIDVAYSAIPKCACSTLKKSLLIAENMVKPGETLEDSQVHEKVKPYIVADFSNTTAQTLKLTVVRDPIKRLLSAYLDKFCTAFANPEVFTIRFFDECDFKHESFSFFDFLNVLECKYKAKSSTLNEHWQNQFEFLQSQIAYDVVIDFEELNAINSITFGGRNIKLLTINSHATPKSDNYINKAHLINSKSLLEYRKKHNRFPSTQSFLEDLKLKDYPSLNSQRVSYTRFLQDKVF